VLPKVILTLCTNTSLIKGNTCFNIKSIPMLARSWLLLEPCSLGLPSILINETHAVLNLVLKF
jgi:hypothetical protein